MWLAPFVNRYFDCVEQNIEEQINTIYLSFDKPINIGAISFWNYSKTPERGAYEISIHLDDRVIYKVIQLIFKFEGFLRKAIG